MKFRIVSAYFGLAIFLSIILSFLQVIGVINPEPLNIAIILGLVLNLGVVITGYVIWQEVPAMDEFSKRLHYLGIAGMSSIMILPLVIVIGLIIPFLLLLGVSITITVLLPQKTRQQSKIKLSFISILFFPVLIILPFLMFGLVQNQFNIYLESTDISTAVAMVYSIGYAIIVYGTIEVQRYVQHSMTVGPDSDILYQKVPA